jgi:hypothetical protein
MSADRYQQAANAGDSASWNKYSYVQNDPVNLLDPSGREQCNPDDPDDPCYCDDDDSCGDDDNATGGSGPTFSVTGWGLAPTPVVTNPGVLTTFFTTIGNAVGGVMGPILISVFFPTATSSTDTMASNWQYYSPEYIEANCELVDEVIEPANNYPGGQSIEREYLCPNGVYYTIHILRTKTGIIKEKHTRPYRKTKKPNAVQKPTGVKKPANGGNE